MEYFSEIIKKPVGEKVILYDPSDWLWQTSPEWLWHISNIKADLAWDITHGDSDIKIAILDNWFDINHPDIENKISPIYDPYDTTYWGTNCPMSHIDHGTGVASFAAGETDGGGQLCSVGFDCMIIAYQGWKLDYLERAHDASLRMGADVLTSSAGYWTCRELTDTLRVEREAIEEIIENGTIIVMPAGNGVGNQCQPDSAPDAQPWFPLNPVYDEDIIIVTSIYSDNKHFYISSEKTHSHYPEVDICSPGYSVMGARQMEMDTCQPYGCCVPNSWPYGGWFTGTSFATPIVAGTAALMKAVNPSLNQADVADIIAETAEPVVDESSYPGLLGSGRINTYKAVMAARPVVYSTIPYNTGFENRFDESWKVHKSLVYGRVDANTNYSPRTGIYHLTMDVIENNHYNTNEAWLHVNLSGKSNILLQFWLQEYSDETHNQDGVFLSDDGGENFVKVAELSNPSSGWHKKVLDLDYLIDMTHLSKTSTFVIKFQQYDNYSIPADGIAIDDIDVCVKPGAPSYVYGPYEHCMYDWETYVISPVNGAISYVWESQSPYLVVQGNGTTAQIRGFAEGSLQFRVKAVNACDQSSNWKYAYADIENCGGPLMMEGSDLFTVIPNPANDFVEVTLNQKSESFKDEVYDFTVHVYNQSNVLVKSKQSEGQSVQLYVGDLINGTYIFRIEYGKESYSYPVIIQH